MQGDHIKINRPKEYPQLKRPIILVNVKKLSNKVRINLLNEAEEAGIDKNVSPHTISVICYRVLPANQGLRNSSVNTRSFKCIHHSDLRYFSKYGCRSCYEWV